MRRIVLSLIVIFCLLFGSSRAMAWNALGHEAIAYTAYQKLTPIEQARVTALLKLNPYYEKWLSYVPANATSQERDEYIFMMAATWPDEIRANDSGYTGPNNPPSTEKPDHNGGYSDKNLYKYWHYVDVPFSQDGTPLPTFPGPSILDKIVAFRAALATNIPDELKSYDLAWLEHLVGDIHQPLHAVARVSKERPKGDAGGNSVKVDGPAKDLHWFWDSAAGSGETRDVRKAVILAEKLPKAPAAKAKDNNENHWTAESEALAKAKVYAGPIGPGLGPFTLTDVYTEQADKLAQQRFALAGARLANLIKTALACGPKSCAH